MHLYAYHVGDDDSTHVQHEFAYMRQAGAEGLMPATLVHPGT